MGGGQEKQSISVVQCGHETALAGELNALFQRIAAEQGWKLGGDLSPASPYVPLSTYFALRYDGVLVGGLHLVRGNPHGLLPTCAVWPELMQSGFAVRTDVADAFLLALDPKLRGRSGGNTACPLFLLLCVAMWQWCKAEGIEELCGIATPRNAVLYRRLGWPLDIAGPERRHWDEPCVPFVMSVERAANEAVRRAERGSDLYRYVLRAALVEPQTYAELT